MRLRQLLEDDDAVSPVIGVILMVAITVILAAVIASFVLGLGPGEAQPSASFSFEEPSGGSGDVTVTHDSGDAIPVSNLYIRGDNLDDDSGKWGGGDFSGASASGEQGGESAVTSGDSATVEVDPDYTVRVVWDNGDNSATLSETSG